MKNFNKTIYLISLIILVFGIVWFGETLMKPNFVSDKIVSNTNISTTIDNHIGSSQLQTSHQPKFNSIKIAIIKPTFTSGAYNNAFYEFYKKYDPTRQSLKNTTEDTSLLTGTITDHFIGNYQPWYIPIIINELNSTLPKASFSILSDENIHQGLIFDKNGTNIYNLLILGHEEYVTQQEYDNFKNFVNNGGKIIFLDGNILYAEVSYDSTKNSVTLVKGHGYEFDGKIVKKGPFERWSDENSEWIGGNYYHAEILYPHQDVNFANNPFDAKFEDEEEYVTNPNVRILFNYGASDPNHIIATYELKYGNGNVIMLGLYGEHLISHQGFMPFLHSLAKGILSNDPSTYEYEIPKISTIR